MTRIVLDASAILAVIGGEPGAEKLTPALLARAVGSAVNLAEIVNKLAQMGPMPEAVRESLVKLELRVEEWSEDMAYRSAEFSRLSKSHGLSLGDRACLTLAKQLRATAVTSDRTWRRLPSLGVPIMIFR